MEVTDKEEDEGTEKLIIEARPKYGNRIFVTQISDISGFQVNFVYTTSTIPERRISRPCFRALGSILAGYEEPEIMFSDAFA
jgi:hypothetical protein